MTKELGEKEAALYDRQIRLWGIQAQEKMQNSKILVSGVSGIHCEILKNLVLAGEIKSCNKKKMF